MSFAVAQPTQQALTCNTVASGPDVTAQQCLSDRLLFKAVQKSKHTMEKARLSTCQAHGRT